jgi:hypothetical protein
LAHRAKCFVEKICGLIASKGKRIIFFFRTKQVESFENQGQSNLAFLEKTNLMSLVPLPLPLGPKN